MYIYIRKVNYGRGAVTVSVWTVEVYENIPIDGNYHDKKFNIDK
jgi:hypothetical protein